MILPSLSLLPATNALGRIKQIIFVRHGEHGRLLDKPTPCLSEVGVGRAMMLSEYFDRAPPGVRKPTRVYAMNGSTHQAVPPSVSRKKKGGRGMDRRGGYRSPIAPSNP